MRFVRGGVTEVAESTFGGGTVAAETITAKTGDGGGKVADEFNASRRTTSSSCWR